LVSDATGLINPGDSEDKDMRAVIGKDAGVKALVAKNKNLKDVDIVKVKHQVYLLTQKDDEERNVLHVVCMNGNRGVL